MPPFLLFDGRGESCGVIPTTARSPTDNSYQHSVISSAVKAQKLEEEEKEEGKDLELQQDSDCIKRCISELLVGSIVSLRSGSEVLTIDDSPCTVTPLEPEERYLR